MAIREKGEFEKIAGTRLYKGDKDRIQSYYPKVGYNRVIRLIVNQHLNKLDAKLEQRLAAKEINFKEDENGESTS